MAPVVPWSKIAACHDPTCHHRHHGGLLVCGGQPLQGLVNG